MKLGRFEHHPDPAIDFCVEVDCLVADHYDVSKGLACKSNFLKKLDMAMDFRVGGDLSAIAAKSVLRKLRQEYA